MWACWSAILERLCHREGNEAKCTCSSNCCDTIVICRSESRMLNDCLLKHSRQESDKSDQWSISNVAPALAPSKSCGELASEDQPVSQLRWPY